MTYPDGFVGTIWSPPWREMDEGEEDAAALKVARQMYAANTHKETKGKVRLDD